MEIDTTDLIAQVSLAVHGSKNEVILTFDTHGMEIQRVDYTHQYYGRISRNDVCQGTTNPTSIVVLASDLKKLVSKFKTIEAGHLDVTWMGGGLTKFLDSDPKVLFGFKGGNYTLGATKAESIVPTSPPSEEVYSVVFRVDQLRGATSLVIPALKNSQEGSVIESALLIVEDGIAKLFSCDGHQLAYQLTTLNEDTENFKALIPGEVLSVVSKMLTGMNPDEDIIVTASNTEAQSYVEISVPLLNSIVVGRTTFNPNQFPKVESFFPNEVDRWGLFDTKELMQSLKRLQVFSERANNVVTLSKEGDRLIGQVKCPDVGEAIENIAIEEEHGLEGAVSLNIKYLMNALQALRSRQVIIGFTPSHEQENRPFYVYQPYASIDMGRFLFMPVKIKD